MGDQVWRTLYDYRLIKGAWTWGVLQTCSVSQIYPRISILTKFSWSKSYQFLQEVTCFLNWSYQLLGPSYQPSTRKEYAFRHRTSIFMLCSGYLYQSISESFKLVWSHKFIRGPQYFLNFYDLKCYQLSLEVASFLN